MANLCLSGLIMLKSIIRSGPVQWILAAFIAAWMALVRVTTRWTIVGREHAEPVWKSGKGVVWCYWHSRIMGAHSIWPRDVQPMLMLISLSPDGQFVARAAEMVGRMVVRGSSAKQKDGKVSEDKGALQAFRSMMSHAAKGGCVGITPDGPRGPRMRAQAGAVRVAKGAKVPLLPSAYAIKGARYVQSWDRFLVPPLFSRGVIVYRPAITIPDKADEATLEAIRVQLEAELTAALQEADRLVGGPVIEPAEAIA
jgi:lysophospholipid acyltransferase (LPLAT)-like uncharacterized protein